MDTNLGKNTKRWIVLMELGSKTGCHQMNERSFSYKNYQFPLCARCTGLLFGQIAALLLFVLFINIDIKLLVFPAVVSILLLGIDGVGQLKNLWISTNPRRLITGLLCGFFVTVLVMRLLLIIVKYFRYFF